MLEPVDFSPHFKVRQNCLGGWGWAWWLCDSQVLVQSTRTGEKLDMFLQASVFLAVDSTYKRDFTRAEPACCGVWCQVWAWLTGASSSDSKDSKGGEMDVWASASSSVQLNTHKTLNPQNYCCITLFPLSFQLLKKIQGFKKDSLVIHPDQNWQVWCVRFTTI